MKTPFTARVVVEQQPRDELVYQLSGAISQALMLIRGAMGASFLESYAAMIVATALVRSALEQSLISPDVEGALDDADACAERVARRTLAEACARMIYQQASDGEVA